MTGGFATHDPVADLDAAHTLTGPSAAHWFGTDLLGRDLYSRVVYGTRLSATAAIVAVSISLTAGSLIGMASEFLGGWLDGVSMRVMDVLVAIPGLLLSLAVVSILGFGVGNVARSTPRTRSPAASPSRCGLSSACRGGNGRRACVTCSTPYTCRAP